MATLCTPRSLPLRSVRGDLDRWFDQFFGPAARAHGEDGNAWYAPAAIWEDEDNYHVELELPGVSSDGVEITYEKNTLVVHADRPAPEEGRNYYHHSRRYGKSRFSMQLPDTVDGEKIDAELRQGVLHLTLAKRPEAQPKKITVKTSD